VIPRKTRSGAKRGAKRPAPPKDALNPFAKKFFRKPPKSESYQFPPGFLWGSATSAYQVEGGITACDWVHWEQEGRIAGGDRAIRSACHYELYERDFELVRELGHNAHRLSLEWSRIEPEEGKWNEAALEHYRKVLEKLNSLGIEPMVTLHHFTTPEWLARSGYWSSPKIVYFFSRYVRKAAEVLLPYCRFWITINEPVLLAYFGYTKGIWPPGRKSFKDGLQVFRHIIEAHAQAYYALHKEAENRKLPVSVGLAHHLRVHDPHRFSNPLDLAACMARAFFINRLLPEALEKGILLPPLKFFERLTWIKGTQDFLGVNYYSRTHIAFDPREPLDMFAVERDHPDLPRTSMGWEIYPRGLYRVLRYLKKFNLPIYITENGIATGDDGLRERFIRKHLCEVAHALKEGIDVRGYFYWSLMDNFEWLDGFAPRFGLIEIDYNTLERRIRPSAWYYKKICQMGILEL